MKSPASIGIRTVSVAPRTGDVRQYLYMLIALPRQLDCLDPHPKSVS